MRILPRNKLMGKLSVKQRLIVNKTSTTVGTITLMYGLWLLFNQEVLSKYLLYQLMESYTNTAIIASVFITVGAFLLIGLATNKRVVKNLSAILTTMIWSTWAVSFFITPPPNSVWVFSILITVLSYEGLWIDRL